MDKLEFWATKSPLAEYHAVTFSHPAFDAPFRLVANQFAEVTLGGDVYMPAPMTITPPEQTSDSQPKLTLTFPRQVVGRQFKQQLSRVQALASRNPVIVNYDVYLGATDSPQLSWQLYASDQTGVAFNGTSVQVVATDDNPMRRSVGPIYDAAIFTGLELI